MPIRRIKDSSAGKWAGKWSHTPPCIHPEHNPPGHIVIKQGEILEHECPACKKIIILRPSMVTW
jgi:hypothetical protein